MIFESTINKARSSSLQNLDYVIYKCITCLTDQVYLIQTIAFRHLENSRKKEIGASKDIESHLVRLWVHKATLQIER